ATMRLSPIAIGAALVVAVVASGTLIQAKRPTPFHISQTVASTEAAGYTPSQGDSGSKRSQVGSPEDDAKIATVVSRLVVTSHYLEEPITEAISSRLFDRYLEALDPQQLYFLQSDVQEFLPMKSDLGPLIWEKGDTSLANKMFQRFLERFD